MKAFIVAVALIASLGAGAQTNKGTRRVVLPNPQLIRCHTAQCSQLWKEDSPDEAALYPAQVLTDFVNGSVVGLTAVYEKSVPIEEIRKAINDRYAKWASKDLNGMWRVEPEQLVIQLTERPDGTKLLIYLKLGGSHAPSAHINGG